jgi:hypothetical protein
MVMRNRALIGEAVAGFGTLNVVIAPFVTAVQNGVETMIPPVLSCIPMFLSPWSVA